MAFYKLNMLYALDRAGWSETYYLESSSNDQAWQDAKPAMQKRLLCLAYAAELIAVRVSDDAIYRDSSLFPLYNYPQFGSAFSPDLANTADLCRIQSQGLYWRQLYMRGLPDLAFDREATPPPEQAVWFSYRDAFLLALRGNQFRIKVLSKSPSFPMVDVTSFGPSAGNKTIVTTAGAHNIDPDQTVSFYNIRGLYTPPGKQIVESTPTANTLIVKYPCPAEYEYPGTGKLRRAAVAYVPIDYTVHERFTSKKVGRPFDLPRGRRPGAKRVYV